MEFPNPFRSWERDRLFLSAMDWAEGEAMRRMGMERWEVVRRLWGGGWVYLWWRLGSFGSVWVKGGRW